MNILHKLKGKKGYTLLELLVVIAVIGIIATIGLVSYTGTQRKARDTKRRGDLKSITNALEQYYAVCGSLYPTPPGGSATAMYTSITCTSPATTIMTTVPKDPSGNAYTCAGCSSTAYTIGSSAWEAEPTPYPSFTNQQ